ncbi:ExbD/TolR family protein [Herbaspirillum lusitanum]|uniref:ExbD/TolR family protein n=1 Tax=Herbaspirillum lusitanum TaxID=213312 RepID=UPI0002E5B474|nr:biopolymer transporter ExbD [Herbaspirillum lusitanum]MCW5297965.1 biopolymer transporter ExbD [Herbaspirillum lusitanum]
MNFRKGRAREELEINLIPFIDVLLVIVIFLMVTTTYSKFTALQITLPTANAEKALEQPFELNVAVDAQGRYAINNVQIAARDAAGLARELQSAVQANSANTDTSGGKPDPVVIINADALAAHQTVINVLEAARTAGFAKVTFAAQTGGK